MGVLDSFDREKVLYYFEEVCKIPHGSGHEKALSDYIVAFAKENGLFCRQDEMANVLIKKDGTAGCETAPTLILQGHIDMVCEQNAGTNKEFLTEPIDIYVEGDYIHAKGTTLGADNGIAVAYMMALLASKDIPHPPLEAVFTVEEEVGMGGATGFDVSDMSGKRFLNLDTGEEGILLSGCSGGRRIRLSLSIEREKAKAGYRPFRIAIRGLKGGHSGSDIHLQRANADCLLGRVLYGLEKELDYQLVHAEGGNMDNAICREADGVVLLSQDGEEKARILLADMEKMLREEYMGQDPSITISMELLREEVTNALTREEKERLIHLLLLLPNGVQTMCMEMHGLVESSNNIGILKTLENEIYLDCAVRSSVESRKDLISDKIQCIASLCGATAEILNDYPGWRYNPDSYMLKLFGRVYQDMRGKEATVSAIHAGLECGLFAKKIPGLDMVSLGPNLYDIHTPDERVSISSTLRVWEFIKEGIKRLGHS